MSKQSEIFQSYMEEVKTKGLELIQNNVMLPTRGAQMRLAGKMVSYKIPMEVVVEGMKAHGLIPEESADPKTEINLEDAINDLPDDLKEML